MTCALFAALVFLADAPPNGDGARTDLYGDPLPPGAMARLGMVRIFPGPVYSPYDPEDLTFSADGKRLLTCGRDGQVRVWDAATGEFLRRQRMSWKPRQGQEELEVAVLSPGGAQMAAWDREKVYVYDALTGKERGRLPAEVEFDPPVLTFSPDGKQLFVQRLEMPGFFGSTIQQLWDLSRDAKHPLLTTLSRSSKFMLDRAAFTPDGKCLVAVEGDTLRRWDTTTGKEIGKGDDRFKVASPLVICPDGKTLAVASSLKSGVYLVEGATGKQRATLQPPADIKGCDLSSFAFSPDGRLLAATYDYQAGKDYGVLLWDVAGLKVARRMPKTPCLGKLVFSPNGKTLAGSGASHEICLWETASGRLLNPPPGHEKPVEALAASPDGKLIASGDADGMLRLWDAVTGKPLRVLKVHREITSCMFSPDGKQVISTGRTGTFREEVTFQVWDVTNGEQRRRIDIDSWVHQVYAAGISADGKRLVAAASVEWDAAKPRLFVWNLATGKRLKKRPYKVKVDVFVNFSGKSLTTFEAHAAFSPDGDNVSVWLGDRIGLEEVATGHSLVTLPAGVGAPLVFSPDGRLLAATISQPKKDPSDGDDVKGLSLLEAASGEEIFRLKIGAFKHAAFTPDGRSVVVADKKSLSVWDTIAGEQLHQRAWPESAVNGEVCSLAVLPGGRAATGMSNGDILLWDLAPLTWPIHKPVCDPSREELHALWSDLANDARHAHRVLHTLAVTPKPVVPFLRDRLQPAVAVDVKCVEKLLADLDGESFPAREAATRELTQLRDRVEPIMRRALEGRPSLEMRRRLQAILAEPKRPPAETLRTLRAIAVLERIGTPEARRVLEKLSGGAMARETREAKAALQRLKRLTD